MSMSSLLIDICLLVQWHFWESFWSSPSRTLADLLKGSCKLSFTVVYSLDFELSTRTLDLLIASVSRKASIESKPCEDAEKEAAKSRNGLCCSLFLSPFCSLMVSSEVERLLLQSLMSSRPSGAHCPFWITINGCACSERDWSFTRCGKCKRWKIAFHREGSLLHKHFIRIWMWMTRCFRWSLLL